MKAEQLIAKKVKHHYNGKEKQVLFDVNSLEDHYDGLLIHKSDIIYLEEGELVNGYVRAGDVNMDDAVSKEFVESPKETEMSFEEAEKFVNTGHLIALPEWKGFWFKNFKTNELLALTKEGEITKSIFDEFKERNDWKVVNPTEEQAELLEDYWEAFENPFEWKDGIVDSEAVLKIEVTAETLNDNPELVAEGIVVGETITVDAVEDVRVFDKEPITEVSKTILESRILKADYIEQPELKAEQIIQGIAPDGVSIDLDTIEEIIPAKVFKKKNNKKQ